MKRVFSIILVLCMVLAMLPGITLAADAAAPIALYKTGLETHYTAGINNSWLPVSAIVNGEITVIDIVPSTYATLPTGFSIWKSMTKDENGNCTALESLDSSQLASFTAFEPYSNGVVGFDNMLMYIDTATPVYVWNNTLNALHCTTIEQIPDITNGSTGYYTFTEEMGTIDALYLTVQFVWEEPDSVALTVQQSTGGTISLDTTEVYAGQIVNVTYTAEPGYTLGYLLVNGEKQRSAWSFIMPDAETVTVTPVFLKTGYAYVLNAARKTTFSEEWHALLLLENGKTEIVELAERHNNGSGVVKNAICSYMIDTDGKYMLSDLSYLTGNAEQVSNKVPPVGEDIADAGTVFVIGTIDRTTGVTTYNVYTGIHNVPTFTANTGAEIEYLVDKNDYSIISHVFCPDAIISEVPEMPDVEPVEPVNAIALYKTGLETVVTSGYNNTWCQVLAIIDNKITATEVAYSTYATLPTGFSIWKSMTKDENGNCAVLESLDSSQLASFTAFEPYSNGVVGFDNMLMYIDTATPVYVWNNTLNALHCTTIEQIPDITNGSTGYYTFTEEMGTIDALYLTVQFVWEEPDSVALTVQQSTGGTISLDTTEVYAGQIVNVTYTAEPGYTLGYLLVNGEKQRSAWSFIMPDAETVTVTPVFLKTGYAYVLNAARKTTFSEEWHALLLLENGKTEIVELAERHNNGSGVVKNAICSYMIDTDGKYMLSDLSYLTGNAEQVSNKVPPVGEDIADAGTVFVIGTIDRTTGVTTYNVYTGIHNVPTFTANTGAEIEYLTDWETGRITLVFCSDAVLEGQAPTLFKLHGVKVAAGSEMVIFIEKKNVPVGSSAVITRSFADGSSDLTETIAMDEWSDYSEDLYCVSYAGVEAKGICDTVTVKIIDASNNVISETWSGNVRQLMLDELGETTDLTEKRKHTAKLYYSAMAQNFFGFGSGATEGLENDIAALKETYADRIVSSRKDNSLLTGEKVIVGTSCLLNSNLQMKVYFVTDDVTVLVNGTNVALQKAEKSDYYFCTLDVAAEDIFTPVKITVLRDGKTVAEATDSVSSYCARLHEVGGNDNCALAESILLYGLTYQK